MNNRKLINIVKGDIQNAINNGDYARNTEKNSNIEFDTKNKQILLDGVPYSNPLLVETTYNELKTLRDNSQLVPGSFYRITDYTNTTDVTFDGLTSNEMDIIMLALSNDTLSEEGWAIIEDNKYKVRYSLDNDTARFSWADNGNIIPGEVQSIQLHYKYNNTIVEGTWYRRGEPETYQGITGYKWEYKYIIPGPNIESYQYGLYTTDEYPTIDSKLYVIGGRGPAIFFNEITDSSPYYGTQILGINTAEPTIIPGGTGIIYRLTDKSGLCKLQWNELKTIRDSKALVADTKYRIVDYQCTTTQENTRSAEHQFDIVLLALSEDKLAEQGWTMMHDNIYYVTFSDGITKKCYWYPKDLTHVNVVDVDTKLGLDDAYIDQFTVNETNKTIISSDWNSTQLEMAEEQNATYNYFQNSKLEAWKVWYSLDNDTTRFAWADDRDYIVCDLGAGDEKFFRNPQDDYTGFYGWFVSDGYSVWTDTETPQVGSYTYDDTGTRMGGDNTNIKDVGADGRGVIYRLIDECNNDCPYDFKNIQYKRKVNNNSMPDNNGNNYSFLYTFSIVNKDNDYEILDASIFAKNFVNDEQGKGRCYSNFINNVDEYSVGISMSNIYILPDIVFASIVANNNATCCVINVKCYDSKTLSMLGYVEDVSFISTFDLISNTIYDGLAGVIICNVSNKVINGVTASYVGFVTEQGGILKKTNLVDL